MPYANNKGADHPVNPPSLISAFVVHCLDCIIPLLAKSKISRLELVSVAEQAGLSLTWLKIPKTGFLVRRLNYYHPIFTAVLYEHLYTNPAIIVSKATTEYSISCQQIMKY